MNKQEIEAQIAGLVLINKADKSFGKSYQNYNLYKFKNCGHTQYLQPTHVRRSSFTCSKCYEAQIAEKASENNMELIGASNLGALFRKYRFNKCGHTEDLRYTTVANRKTDRCSTCYEESLKLESEKYGLIYQGMSDLKGVYRRYKFASCGHFKDIQPSCIPVGRFECKECTENSIIAACSVNGLELISKQKDRNWLFKLPCGHTRQIRTDHAVDGSWECQLCNESHYEKESNVYLFRFYSESFEWLKLGYAKNLEIRKSNYKVIKGCNFELLRSVKFDTGLEAQTFEKTIHNKYKNKRLCKNTMKSYMLSNGHTECYDISMKDILLNEIEGLNE